VLKRQGLKKRVIARQLGISRHRVKRSWPIQAPPKYQRRALAKGLDPLATKMQEMVQQQFIGTRIFAELTKLGYQGLLTSLYRHLRQYQAEDGAKATIRFEIALRQQMQYDWTEWRLQIGGQTRSRLTPKYS
jgi:transposase